MPINAPKFRKGDRVLVMYPDGYPAKTSNFNISGFMDNFIGSTRQVTDVIKHGRSYFYLLKDAVSHIDGFEWRFAECDLKLVAPKRTKC